MRNIDDSDMKISIDRRSFLGITGAAAVATLAGVLSTPAVAEPSAHSGRRKLGLLEVSTVGLGVQNMSRKDETTVPYRPEMLDIIRAATLLQVPPQVHHTYRERAMKMLMLGLFLSTLIVQSSYAQQSPAPPTETIKTAASHTPEQQEVFNLSNMKWDWMADKKVDSLETLFDDKAMFTHMGGTWGKTQELATIKSGGIWYKKAFVYAVDARIFGNTAILLEDMDLQAVVGAHEVTNPFMVTEVYSKENGKWKLAQLTFSHLLRPVKVDSNKN